VMTVYQSYHTQKILPLLTAHAGLVMVSGKNAYTLVEHLLITEHLIL
jgi:hypothetical protein